jgi:hypothetical protein
MHIIVTYARLIGQSLVILAYHNHNMFPTTFSIMDIEIPYITNFIILGLN